MNNITEEASDVLKPCWFCGSSAISIISTRMFKGASHYGYCNDCSCCGPQRPSPVLAETSWNTRKHDPSALVEALREMIYETTSLSPMEADGGHWCKISGHTLDRARAALAKVGGR